MDLTVNLAPSYRDLKDPTTRQNFDDTVEQKRVIDLRACHNHIVAESMVWVQSHPSLDWDACDQTKTHEGKILFCFDPQLITFTINLIKYASLSRDTFLRIFLKISR